MAVTDVGYNYNEALTGRPTTRGILEERLLGRPAAGTAAARVMPGGMMNATPAEMIELREALDIGTPYTRVPGSQQLRVDSMPQFYRDLVDQNPQAAAARSAGLARQRAYQASQAARQQALHAQAKANPPPPPGARGPARPTTPPPAARPAAAAVSGPPPGTPAAPRPTTPPPNAKPGMLDRVIGGKNNLTERLQGKGRLAKTGLAIGAGILPYELAGEEDNFINNFLKGAAVGSVGWMGGNPVTGLASQGIGGVANALTGGGIVDFIESTPIGPFLAGFGGGAAGTEALVGQFGTDTADVENRMDQFDAISQMTGDTEYAFKTAFGDTPGGADYLADQEDTAVNAALDMQRAIAPLTAVGLGAANDYVSNMTNMLGYTPDWAPLMQDLAQQSMIADNYRMVTAPYLEAAGARADELLSPDAAIALTEQ